MIHTKYVTCAQSGGVSILLLLSIHPSAPPSPYLCLYSTYFSFIHIIPVYLYTFVYRPFSVVLSVCVIHMKLCDRWINVGTMHIWMVFVHECVCVCVCPNLTKIFPIWLLSVLSPRLNVCYYTMLVYEGKGDRVFRYWCLICLLVICVFIETCFTYDMVKSRRL